MTLRFTTRLFFSIGILVVAASLATADDQWETIFDGKAWGNWKPNERPESWKIEDGCFVGNGQRSHLYFERDELTDFELKTEVMINQGGNSGIYFHIAQHPEGWFFDGHEVQVNNTHGDPVKTGSLWGVVKLYDAPVKDNVWFEMHIVVAGQTIDVFINGKRRLTYVEPEGIQGPRKISKGYIALQAHDPGSVVRYRNIRLKKPAADNTNKTSQRLPTTAPGWNIELLAEAPLIQAPTAVVQADDGTIYLGQDPMDMNGPTNVRADSVVTLRWKEGIVSKQVFADHLGAVMGLEIIGNTLFVAHAPYLTALRDTDGNGVADHRLDLIQGLGPENPAFNGYNDHVVSGICDGMDGYLYVTFGDKGIPQARARDGTLLTCHGGGILRVRPDGTDAEIIASGLRNPLSPALDQYDNAFTYGNDDDSKQWPNGIFHLIDGGQYGYPYDFLDAPHRCLAPITGQIGGAGSLGFCFNGLGLAPQFHGNLFFADWALQRLLQYDIEPQGATFRLIKKSAVVSNGPVDDFRPVAAVAGADDNSILLTDWALPSILRRDAKAGRLFRLTWSGAGAMETVDLPLVDAEKTAPIDELIDWLGHASYRVRLRAQRELIRRGQLNNRSTTDAANISTRLSEILERGTPRQRIHTLWILEAIDFPKILSASDDKDPRIRTQAIRAVGNRQRRSGLKQLYRGLQDRQPTVRREAAIALGRIAAPESLPELLQAIGDQDRFVAWSVSAAVKRIDHWNADTLATGILESDGIQQDQWIQLTEQVWRLPVVECWCTVLDTAKSPELRRRAGEVLTALYHRHPPWDGHWWGSNPLAGRRPVPTLKWSNLAARKILQALGKGLHDENLREMVVHHLIEIGKDANRLLAVEIEKEPSIAVACEMIAALGRSEANRYVELFDRLARDPKRPMAIRIAAATAMTRATTEASNQALLAYSAFNFPAELIATSLPTLAQRNKLSSHQLKQCLQQANPVVKAAALQAIAIQKTSETNIESAVITSLADSDTAVQHAAIVAAGANRYRRCSAPLLELYRQGLSNETMTPQLCDEIILSLSALPNASAVEVYLDGLSTGEPAIQTACFQALKSVWQQIPPAIHKQIRESPIESPARPFVQRLLADFRSVKTWHVIGPFPRELHRDFYGGTGFDYSRTWYGLRGKVVHWQPRSTDQEGTWNFDADTVSGTELGFDANNSSQINMIAHAVVDSPVERDGFLLVGSSGPLRIWVNGQQVHRFRDVAGRPFVPDQDLIRIHLHQGTNELLVLSHIGIGPWRTAVLLSTPEEEKILQQAKQPNRQQLATYARQHPGNAEYGRQLFFDRQKGRCAKCHSVHGEGAQVGPDLASFASKYNRDEAIESILQPSARLTQGYIPMVIATDQGKVFSGLVKNETTTHVEMINAQGKLNRIARETIEVRRPAQVSTMPEGLVDRFTAKEFSHLIEFLMSLRQTNLTSQ